MAISKYSLKSAQINQLYDKLYEHIGKLPPGYETRFSAPGAAYGSGALEGRAADIMSIHQYQAHANYDDLEKQSQKNMLIAGASTLTSFGTIIAAGSAVAIAPAIALPAIGASAALAVIALARGLYFNHIKDKALNDDVQWKATLKQLKSELANSEPSYSELVSASLGSQWAGMRDSVKQMVANAKETLTRKIEPFKQNLSDKVDSYSALGMTALANAKQQGGIFADQLKGAVNTASTNMPIYITAVQAKGEEALTSGVATAKSLGASLLSRLAGFTKGMQAQAVSADTSHLALHYFVEGRDALTIGDIDQAAVKFGKAFGHGSLNAGVELCRMSYNQAIDSFDKGDTSAGINHLDKSIAMMRDVIDKSQRSEKGLQGLDLQAPMAFRADVTFGLSELLQLRARHDPKDASSSLESIQVLVKSVDLGSMVAKAELGKQLARNYGELLENRSLGISKDLAFDCVCYAAKSQYSGKYATQEQRTDDASCSFKLYQLYSAKALASETDPNVALADRSNMRADANAALLRSASAGYGAAQLMIGSNLVESNNPEDKKEGVHYLSVALDNGISQAQYALKALAGAEHPNPDAAFALFKFHQGALNLTQADKYLAVAAEAGHAEAQDTLAKAAAKTAEIAKAAELAAAEELAKAAEEGPEPAEYEAPPRG